jgi:hypothetical protein
LESPEISKVPRAGKTGGVAVGVADLAAAVPVSAVPATATPVVETTLVGETVVPVRSVVREPEPDRVLDGVRTVEDVGLEDLAIEGVGVGAVVGGAGAAEGVAVLEDVDGATAGVCAWRRENEEQESAMAAKAKKQRRKEIGGMKIRGRKT